MYVGSHDPAFHESLSHPENLDRHIRKFTMDRQAVAGYSRNPAFGLFVPNIGDDQIFPVRAVFSKTPYINRGIR